MKKKILMSSCAAFILICSIIQSFTIYAAEERIDVYGQFCGYAKLVASNSYEYNLFLLEDELSLNKPSLENH